MNDDCSDADFYSDPSNLKPGKRLRVETSSRPTLSEHVPIRFNASVIAEVKALADKDGMTVSSWIRRLVLQELERRARPATSAE